MMDSIDNDINKKEKYETQKNKFLDMFENEISPDLEMIQVSIKRIRNKAKDWYGYDFREEAEELIHDLI